MRRNGQKRALGLIMAAAVAIATGGGCGGGPMDGPSDEVKAKARAFNQKKFQDNDGAKAARP